MCQKRAINLLYLTDFLMILAVCANLGAVFVTNAMAVKDMTAAGIEPVMYESNPIAVEVTDFAAPPPEYRSIMYAAFILHFGKWIGLGLALGMYLWMRHYASDKWKMLRLSLCVGIWFTMMAFDFANNLGLWFGSML